MSGTIQDQCVRLCFRPQLDDNCFCGIAAEAILSVLWKGAMVKVTLNIDEKNREIWMCLKIGYIPNEIAI